MSKNTESTKTPAGNVDQHATKFKVKRNLTLPVLKITIDVPVYLKIMEPMKIGKKMEEKKDAAVLCSVTDLESGELKQFLVPAVMQGVLHDEYGAPKFGKGKDNAGTVELEPGDGKNGYVGLAFSVTKHAKQSGKQYHPHTVQEIEVS